MLKPAPDDAWKIVAVAPGLVARVTGPRPSIEAEAVVRDHRRALPGAAPPEITVEIVDEIHRTATGTLRHFEAETSRAPVP